MSPALRNVYMGYFDKRRGIIGCFPSTFELSPRLHLIKSSRIEFVETARWLFIVPIILQQEGLALRRKNVVNRMICELHTEHRERRLKGSPPRCRHPGLFVYLFGDN